MTMLQVHSEIKIDIKTLIGGVAQLETRDVEHLLSEISVILARRKVSAIPHQESALLQSINRSIEQTKQHRYDHLQNKLLAAQITPDEHTELLSLIELVEQADVERLKALIELAQLRQISLDALMSQLDIHPPAAYV